jgi:hypothetical protein
MSAFFSEASVRMGSTINDFRFDECSGNRAVGRGKQLEGESTPRALVVPWTNYIYHDNV